MPESKILPFLLLSFLISTGLHAKSLDQAKLHEDVSTCNSPGIAVDEKFHKQINNFEEILNTNTMLTRQNESKSKQLCKCRLIFNNSSGYKVPVTTQIFPDAVSNKNETPLQSCARVNGAAPSIGIPDNAYYTWEAYDCGPASILVEKPRWEPKPKIENNPKYLCKCELLRNDSDGSKRVKLGYDSITYENGSGSCSSANDPAPESWNRAVQYSWSEYDCRSYPLSEN